MSKLPLYFTVSSISESEIRPRILRDHTVIPKQHLCCLFQNLTTVIQLSDLKQITNSSLVGKSIGAAIY